MEKYKIGKGKETAGTKELRYGRGPGGQCSDLGEGRPGEGVGLWFGRLSGVWVLCFVDVAACRLRLQLLYLLRHPASAWLPRQVWLPLCW